MKNFKIIIVCLFFSAELNAQSVLLSENFNSYDGTPGTTPAGWTFSFHGFYSASGYYGPSGPNSYRFSETNAQIVSPTFLKAADTLTFWLRRASGNTESYLIIEGYIDLVSNWDTLSVMDSLPTSGTVIKLKLDSNTTQLRFTYIKSAGNLAFDDFSVTTSNTADFTAPVITLIGPAVMTAFTDTVFNDPGVTAFDNVDGDITYKIVRTGFIKPDSIGDYTLYYNVSDMAGNPAQEVIRLVHVIDSDTIPPVLTLNGPNPYSLTPGGSYIEPGATALDNVDGDLTSEITISGAVDSSQTGVYQISYSVTDNSGNSSTLIREVHVYRTPGKSCAYPFFSEYIDPDSGNTKVLEIFNPTGFNINMSEYSLHKFTNGAATSTLLTLYGIVQAGGTFIICHNLADTNVLAIANMNSSFLGFNGDDGLMLMKGSDTLDIFGKIGQDPGTSWANADSTISTANMALRRKSSVTMGVVDNPASFDPSSQWLPFTADDFSGLGNHSMDTCDFTTSIHNEFVTENVTMYVFPNPAENKIFFTLADNTKEFSSYEIKNVNGKVVVRDNCRLSMNNKYQEVNTRNLKPGFYFLNLVSEDITNKPEYYKFIVVR